MGVSYYCHEGSFNWAKHSETQFQLVLSVVNVQGVTNTTISETFNEEPDWKNKSISVILQLLEDRVNSYWLYTAKDQQLEKIARLKEHIKVISQVWASARIETLRGEIKEKFNEIEELRYDNDLYW